MARPTPLETAEVRLGQRIKHENVCKMDTLSTVGIGTHKQARMNDHRATQKWVEYYQSRIIFLKAGGYAALTSSQRATLKDLRPMTSERQTRRAAAKIRLEGIRSRKASGNKARQLVLLTLAAYLAQEGDMRDMACLLAEWDEEHAPAIAVQTVAAFQDAPNRAGLLQAWEAAACRQLGLLWLGGLQTPAVGHAIKRVFA